MNCFTCGEKQTAETPCKHVKRITKEIALSPIPTAIPYIDGDIKQARESHQSDLVDVMFGSSLATVAVDIEQEYADIPKEKRFRLLKDNIVEASFFTMFRLYEYMAHEFPGHFMSEIEKHGYRISRS